MVNLLFWELWKCLTISNKIIVSCFHQVFMLNFTQKVNFVIHSLLRYCREISNFLFCVIWACLALHMKNGSINLKKRLTIISREKSTPSFRFCLRYCKDIVLGALGIPNHAHPKWSYQFLENVCVYLQVKNQFHSPYFSGDTAKICTYFGYFGHVWLYITKMIVSTFRRLRCLSACQK